jgi:hypothetical protein
MTNSLVSTGWEHHTRSDRKHPFRQVDGITRYAIILNKQREKKHMKKKTMGWLAGLSSLFAMVWIGTYFPAPEQIWVESTSRYYDDSGFQDPLWYGMTSIATLLVAIAIGRSVAGASNRQLKPFIYMAIYLGMAVFVTDAIVAQLPVIVGTIVGMFMTVGILYGLYVIWQKFSNEINGRREET